METNPVTSPNRLAHWAVAACAVAVASVALSPNAHAEFMRLGAQVWVPTGSATIEEVSSTDEDPGELDDSSGIGLSAYALFGLSDALDTGLALHHLSTVEHIREDKKAFDIGSQTDLNLRVAYSLPIPAVLVSVHGEGGLTLFSPSSEIPKLPLDSDNPTYRTDQYNTDDTSNLGWNAGGGFQLGLSIVPFVNVFVGVDFQFYSVQLFKGSDLKSGDNFTGSDATDEIETNMSGSRVRFALGVEFNL